MRFQPFNWPATMDNRWTHLPHPDYQYFDPLLAEAVEDGFNLAAFRVCGVITPARRPSGPVVNVIVVGEEFVFGSCETTKEAFGPTLHLRNPDTGTAFFSVTAWHTVLRVQGNPIELHVKWSPTEGEQRAMLNFQAIQRRHQLGAVPELLGLLESLSNGIGRPGSDAYAKAAARILSGECATYREAFEMMIDEMEESPEKNYLLADPDEFTVRYANFKGAMKRKKKASLRGK